ncbi:MAG TPA: FHA domain-containing protein, partial [Gemmataceae bacterium]|nr:FHA domain-containing protein [Gemmataceae bacterium]
MPDLVAISSDGEPRWRHPLPLRPVTLGRVPNRSEWSCPWDDSISRLHATVTWERDRLRVQRDPGSRNPVFFHGEPLDDFIVSPGDSFVIGETRFTLEPGQPVADPTPNVELTCSPQQLRQLKFLDAGERIEVLAQLPELIRFSPSEEELQGRVLAVLLQGIPRAAAAAIVQVRPGDAATPPEVEVRAAATRDEKSAAVPLSRRLVLDAITVRLQSVLYRWDVQAASPDFTAQPATDWALCVPLPDAPSPHWGLYVSGRLAGAEATPGATAADDLLAGDLKFAELAADIFGSLRLVGDLQRRHSLLTRFLSRPVLAALAQEEADLDQVLRRRQADVTVLFCDIRGSCLIGEEGREDLHGLWDRIS